MSTLRRITALAVLCLTFVAAEDAGAQTNVAAQSNNPLAQGFASDAGWTDGFDVVNPNNPLDGNSSGTWDPYTFWHSNVGTGDWWYVDLGGMYNVSSIVFYNRTDCCDYRIDNATFQLWTSQPDFVNGGAVFTAILNSTTVQSFNVPNLNARYASVQAGVCGSVDCVLNFPEVEVYAVAAVVATPEPASMVLLATGLIGVAGLARRRRHP